VHVLPEAQVMQPVKPMPPHCEYLVAEQLDGELVEVGLADVVEGELVDLGGVLEPEVGEDPPVEPLVLHPTRDDWMEMSSYQKVLTPPPYDSQPK